jgi:cytochrome P450
LKDLLIANYIKFETLRLYGPVTSLPRTTDTTPLSLKVKGKDYIIPPHTMIMQNIFAIHTDPEVWGSDSYEWKPERWIVKRDGFDGIENEELMTPPAGYIPWASGARVCPGRKFAQVEFVAVVATIMAKHHVRVDSLDRETRKQTSERVHDALLNSRVLITLKMVNPEKVKLVWEED